MMRYKKPNRKIIKVETYENVANHFRISVKKLLSIVYANNASIDWKFKIHISRKYHGFTQGNFDKLCKLF